MFGAVEILLPGNTIRLLDGAGRLTIAGGVYVGRDDVFGVLGGISDYSDGTDAEAPNITLTMLPPSNAAMAMLAAPAAQGSRVTVLVGAVDQRTGLVIDTSTVFIGEIDMPTQKITQNGRTLELSVVSVWDRFFDADDGARLNNGFHQSIWPGELGFEFAPVVQVSEPWGNDGPRPSLITDVKTREPPNLGGYFGSNRSYIP